MKEQLMELMKFCSELGADYADIRVKDILTEAISAEDCAVRNLSKNRTKGAGIRVYVDGSMGFAATNDFEKLKETAKKACEIAKASRLLQTQKIKLSPKPAAEDSYRTPYEIDPFTVPLEEKLALLMECEKLMNSVDGVTKTNSRIHFRKEESVYCDSEGSYITQEFMQSGGYIQAMAVAGGDAQTRSYPTGMGGNISRAGYEYIKSLDMTAHALETAEESVKLANAPDCPAGLFDVILDPNQMHLQIHESIGHPIELDRVFGSESAYAGESFISPSYLDGSLKYGSEHVTVVADATCQGGLGCFGYDDDGVKSHNTVIIDKGIFKNFITSREYAPKVGQASNGASLADGWKNPPLVRMTNINLLPGDFELDELISGIDYGFYFAVNKSWSIDDKRINFQFACEIAYEIKNGKMTGKIYKNPIYSGITTEFWGSCDGVANEKHWVMMGVYNCGKGQPGQAMRVGHGSSPARFRKVKVGVSDVK